MPQMQRSAGIRGKTHHDTVFCLLKTRKLLYMYSGPGHIVGNIRGQNTELMLPFSRGESSYLGEYLVQESRYFLGPGAELGILPHDHPYHRPRFGKTRMFHRILESKDQQDIPEIVFHIQELRERK
jgi:hypothetical protein